MSPRSGTTVSLRAVAQHYNFPKTTGKGQRIALLEMGGGFYPDDLQAQCRKMGVPVPKVSVHALNDVKSEGQPPLSAGNAPLDVKTLQTIIAEFAKPGARMATIQKKYGPDGTFERFIETLEATMDLQIVATLAPGAQIDVYFYPQIAEGLVAAIEAAIAHGANVMSISDGEAESDWGPGQVELINAALKKAASKGITICCSSGDTGARNRPAGMKGDKLARVNFPASSPYALACGGTSLKLKGDAFTSEITWNTTVFGMPCATGGGMSGMFKRPSYQSKLDAPSKRTGIWVKKGSGKDFDGRWIPDVAAHADRANGYSIVLGGKAFAGDGTSAAAPLWAALLACIGEELGRPVGWFNKLLPRTAAAGAFNDITKGNNAMTGVTRSFSAGPGWDACTGYGSPNGERLVAVLSKIKKAK